MKMLFIKSGFAILLVLAGCNNRIVPLQGTYQDQPYQIVTTASKEQVWTKLVDLFTAKGLAIKTIDKNDGIITTDHTSFLDSYAWESKGGILTNPSALVVCSKVRGAFTIPASLKPTVLTGQWAVRVKQEGDKTIINTRLANAAGKIEIDHTGYSYATKETYNLMVRSTGIFEKSIEAALK